LKRSTGGNDNSLIELDLPSMLPDNYFFNVTEKEQNLEHLIQLRRFLLANGKPFPNERLTKLFFELKKENFSTSDPTSIYVTRDFVEKNFDNGPIEIDILANKKKKIRFNQKVQILNLENEPIKSNSNELKDMIGGGNFQENKLVDEALYNEYL